MATTTNYGWTTPDDTALVKDGAAAIRTLGSSVDTTTKALNPSTTLGDIEYRSSTANTNTRLGIGSAGQVLTVAAGVPSWATSASGGLTLLDTLTLSGSSVTSATFSSAYTGLFFYIKSAYNSAADEMRLRLNADTGSNYAYGNWRRAGSGTQFSNSNSNTSIPLGVLGTSSTIKERLVCTGWIWRPSDTDVVSVNSNFYSYAGPDNYTGMTAGNYDNSAAITSLTLFPESGTFSGGTCYIYGVN
jgi:hypothetical protein